MIFRRFNGMVEMNNPEVRNYLKNFLDQQVQEKHNRVMNKQASNANVYSRAGGYGDQIPNSLANFKGSMMLGGAGNQIMGTQPSSLR